ncbi:hypothetical protein NKY44_26830 [Sinorhizobium meliloti]|uniref:hypothetical protein n=1 Tax=Rhizobium meliloti TaxID=382 RepID=UPI003D6626C7
MKRVSIRSVAISCFLFAAPSFAAADKALCSSDDGSLVVFGDIGFAKIKAQEFSYVGDHEISQLNWESKGVTLFTVGVDGQIDNDWSLKGSVKVGTGGNGQMDRVWRVRHLFERGGLPKRPPEGSRLGKRRQLPAKDSGALPQPERRTRPRVQGNVGLLRAKGHVLTWPRSRYLHQKTIAALLPV